MQKKSSDLSKIANNIGLQELKFKKQELEDLRKAKLNIMKKIDKLNPTLF